jgi:hypothetical protein
VSQEKEYQILLQENVDQVMSPDKVVSNMQKSHSRLGQGHQQLTGNQMYKVGELIGSSVDKKNKLSLPKLNISKTRNYDSNNTRYNTEKHDLKASKTGRKKDKITKLDLVTPHTYG